MIWRYHHFRKPPYIYTWYIYIYNYIIIYIWYVYIYDICIYYNVHIIKQLVQPPCLFWTTATPQHHDPWSPAATLSHGASCSGARGTRWTRAVACDVELRMGNHGKTLGTYKNSCLSFPEDPWCWDIDLHWPHLCNFPNNPNVGKYSSTMDP